MVAGIDKIALQLTYERGTNYAIIQHITTMIDTMSNNGIDHNLKCAVWIVPNVSCVNFNRKRGGLLRLTGPQKVSCPVAVVNELSAVSLGATLAAVAATCAMIKFFYLDPREAAALKEALERSHKVRSSFQGRFSVSS